MVPAKILPGLHRLLRHEKIRFILVGALNTSVDFVILFLLVEALDMNAIVANVISTSVALSVSYLLNKKAVFGDTDTNDWRRVMLFVVVTLAGLWILQGAVIALLSPLLNNIVGKSAALFAAKLIATLFSLTWNYEWYSRVVFKRRAHESK